MGGSKADVEAFDLEEIPTLTQILCALTWGWDKRLLLLLSVRGLSHPAAPLGGPVD